ncbi:MAG: cupin domain-containing protein [Clostridiaceae bacterium]|nr:cupin domain-containing protein [Clostridiaceae bacterium]
MKVADPAQLEAVVRPDGLVMMDLFSEPDLGFKQGTAVFAPGTHVPPGTHEQHEFSYIISGSIKVTVSGVEYRVSAGMSCHIPAGAVHESINDGDTDCELVWNFVDDK